ncbi:MAG: hypothetical protein ACPGQL_02220 [Thermoplasmatota archaeon]
MQEALATDAATFAPGELLASLNATFEGTFLAGIGVFGCPNVYADGFAFHPWELDMDLPNGTVAEAVNIHVELEVFGTNFDSDMVLLSPEGEAINQTMAFNPVSGATESLTVAGPLPAGIYEIFVGGCTAINGDYRVTASAELVVAEAMDLVDEEPDSS